MQRRAAAIYAVFFLVVAIGAYTATTVAQEPSIHLDSGNTYAANDQVNTGNRTYMVGNISSGSQGASTELNYTNESARLTLTIQNGSNVTRFSNGSYRPLANGESAPSGGGRSGTSGGSSNASGGGNSGTTASGSTGSGTNASAGNATTGGANNATTTNANATGNASAGNSGSPSKTASIGTQNESVSVYRALVENGSDNTTRLNLHEVFNLTALIRGDSAVANTTLSGANDTRYVRYTDNNSTKPVDAYLPTSQTRNFTQGDAFKYGNNSTTITSLSQDGAILTWNGTQTTTTEVEEGANVTLGSTQYVAHFPDNSTLKLTEDVGAYQEEVAGIDEFHERIRGFWGVAILSVVTALGLIGLSYLPARG